MSAQATASIESPQWAYFRFGLIVTGETEQEHLPKLFKSLIADGNWIGFVTLKLFGKLNSVPRKHQPRRIPQWWALIRQSKRRMN